MYYYMSSSCNNLLTRFYLCLYIIINWLIDFNCHAEINIIIDDYAPVICNHGSNGEGNSGAGEGEHFYGLNPAKIPQIPAGKCKNSS